MTPQLPLDVQVLKAHEDWHLNFGDEQNPALSWEMALKVMLATRESTSADDLQAASLEMVRDAELEEMLCRRKLLGEEPGFEQRASRLLKCAPDPKRLDPATLQAALENEIAENGPIVARSGGIQPERLTGLTFSGGGIRSATFNLGVLQALAKLNLLRQFDYLSTASGGGYIAAWFAAWVKRAGWAEVAEDLDPERMADPTTKKRGPIQFLREFSNYLTPEVGLLSGDTWATVSIWLRNTMLNFAILAAFIAFLLLLPRCAWWIQKNYGTWLNSGWRSDVLYPLIAIAIFPMLFNLSGFTCKPPPEMFSDSKKTPWYTKQNAVLLLIGAPVFLVAIFTVGHLWTLHSQMGQSPSATPSIDLRRIAVMCWLLIGTCIFGLGFYIPSLFTRKKFNRTGLGLWLLCSAALSYAITLWIYPLATIGWPYWVCLGSAATLLLWAMGWFGGYPDCFIKDKSRAIRYPLGALALLLEAAIAGFISTGFLWLIADVLHTWGATSRILTVLAVPMVIANFSIIAYLFIGLMGRHFPDAKREWISRLAGWLLLLSLGWIALFGCALFGPWAIEYLESHVKLIPAKKVLAAIWAAITWLSVQAAKSENTGKSAASATARSRPVTEIFAQAGPYVFIVGLFTLIAFGLDNALKGKPEGSDWIALGLSVLVMCLSFTVDVNEFSMHHFYRNRLVRCYLGASNAHRQVNGFTGFDARDDIVLARFAPTQTTPGMPPYLGPYPIINAALNLTSGERLAYQERKAASFIFTPRYCGIDGAALRARFALEAAPEKAYRPTLRYAYPVPGMHIGSAMAISGAAMNPNRGYHSSPATAFMLTVFNVRLGWWLGNPRLESYWRHSSPIVGLAYLLKELFGSSSDSAGYVYLSDGGHFDNLGIYELVKRQCRLIVACDAEEDQAFGFEGLGNAIRKCRADLGVEIDIDVDQLRLQTETKLSKWHCVVGKIHYENVKEAFATGTLVYLKSSLTGDESSDLLEYSLRRREFPHQTTLDQFFDESQFESYRKLGYHVAKTAFEKAIQDAIPGEDGEPPSKRDMAFMEDLAYTLSERWYPPSSAIEKSFTRHTEALNDLHERLRSDPNLRFLDLQFYPEWRDLEKFATNRGIREILEKGCEKITSRQSYDPLWLPSRREEIRAGFFFCNLLIQLMENVYLDLNLERYGDHPDNQGWMNLFRHWAESGMFRVTYSISASTYGSRFRTFCGRDLDIQAGKVRVVEMPEDGLTSRERNLLNKIRGRGIYAKTPCQALQLEIKPRNTDSGAPPFRFIFAMALIDREQIVYFRVRRHLRGIGLARRGLKYLFGERKIKKDDPVGDPALRIRKSRIAQFRRVVDSVRP